ncbi:MAG: hypothetical protein VXX85_03790, partial [Candidatus Margulisiibacteriota bacterium]|nr:hypothetical protein [Candidatus Margulisiibacteriota bacterium]
MNTPVGENKGVIPTSLTKGLKGAPTINIDKSMKTLKAGLKELSPMLVKLATTFENKVETTA